jgi:hypothetical protein
MMDFVIALTLCVGFVFIVVTVANAQDEKIQDKIRSEAEEQREKIRRDSYKDKKDKTLKSLRPTLNIVDQTKISRKAIESYPFDELYPVIELLESDQQILEAVDILHDNIKHVYIELLVPFSDQYSTKSEEIFEAQLAIDLESCMDFGRRQIIKQKEVMTSFTDKDTYRSVSTKISKTHSWDDLKSQFD